MTRLPVVCHCPGFTISKLGRAEALENSEGKPHANIDFHDLFVDAEVFGTNKRIKLAHQLIFEAVCRLQEEVFFAWMVQTNILEQRTNRASVQHHSGIHACNGFRRQHG